MSWWSTAATVSASIFVLSLGTWVGASSILRACDQWGATCEGIPFAARSLLVGSGAFLAAALVALSYASLLDRARREHSDTRPLVSVRGRRRH